MSEANNQEVFSGSAAASNNEIKERQASTCDNKYGEFWYSQANLSEQRVAVTEALDTVAKCIELAQDKKLAIRTVISQDNRQIDFVMRWNDAVALKVAYAGPSPWNALQCFVSGDPVTSASELSTTISPLTEWVFSCMRTPKPVSINQEIVNCVEPVNIVFSTDKVSDSIPIPRACDTDYLLSRAKEVELQVAELRQLLSRTQSDISILSDNLQNLKIGVQNNSSDLEKERQGIKYTFVNSNIGCPAGWTDVGWTGIIMRNDFYGNNLGIGSYYNRDWTWTHPKLCKRN